MKSPQDMNTNQIIKQAQEEFKERFEVVIEQSKLGTFKQGVDPEMLEFLDQAITQAVEEERKSILEEIMKHKGKSYVLDGNDFGFIADEVIDDILDKLTK